MNNDTNSTVETVTVKTTSKGSLDFSLDNTLDSIYYADDDTSNYYVTVPDSTCDIDLTNLGDSITLSGDDLTFNTTPASIKIGDVELDETSLKKLKAIVDMIEGLDDDNELKQMFNTQHSLNEISK